MQHKTFALLLTLLLAQFGCLSYEATPSEVAADAEALTASSFVCTDPGPGGTTVNGSELWTSAPAMRGAYTSQTLDTVVFFKYFGDTSTLLPLADGSIRRQVCAQVLKQDPCNILYVCWRTAGLVQTLMKSNPTQHTSAQCGDNGYTTVAQYGNGPFLLPDPNYVHSLRVTLDSGHTFLNVITDASAVHHYTLPASATALSPTVFGLRSDNSVVHFTSVSP
jgi:hypothetical protein